MVFRFEEKPEDYVRFQVYSIVCVLCVCEREREREREREKEREYNSIICLSLSET